MKKIFIGFLLLLLVVFLSFSFYNKKLNSGSGKKSEDVIFVVKPGDSVDAIAANLKNNGVIDSIFLFKLYVWQSEKESELKAGDYILNPMLSIIEIVKVLSNGENISRETEVVIIEGWNIEDIDKYLKEHKDLDINDFSSLAKMPLIEWPFAFEKPSFLEAMPERIDLEGFLFPDTYRVFKDAGAQDIIKKMLNNFEAKLDPGLRNEIKEQNKTYHEIITLASIIEKEVSNEKDRPLVAGILVKRMEIGMRLEVDSTINYISGKNDPSASARDLEIDSPYNTYKYYGLPPGPISNPGLSAIKAAINPVESDYLFYLNRQDTGETIFSKNFDEHLRNKNKYLK